ncbi:MAG: DUF4174 domain-containing protein [Gammaproteobacteria bacterium]|nr:DUF4174 domain-containing protein [Gammaproteobacteria bacterium]
MVISSMMDKQQPLLSIGLILLGALLGTTAHVSAAQMSEYVWQNRPLLLFAPSIADSRLQQTRHNLQRRRCELDDRNMIIGVILEQGQSRLDDQTISPSDATTLRKRYAIDRDQFAAILIGKDGSEKYRRYDVPELDGIFALIDGMPMRQDEMSQNPVDCSEQPQ